MLVRILIVLGILLASALIFIAVQPADFKVSRSALISAPPATVFAHVNDFREWDDWSPWAKLDPAAKVTFEGPAAGEGAVFRWSGNDKVGEGSNTITESRPNELIRIQLEFLKPMEGKSDVEFSFKPAGDQTEVTWTMSGKNNFIGKAFSIFMDCDKMIGPDFEKGLANLDAAVKAQPAP